MPRARLSNSAHNSRYGWPHRHEPAAWQRRLDAGEPVCCWRPRLRSTHRPAAMAARPPRPPRPAVPSRVQPVQHEGRRADRRAHHQRQAVGTAASEHAGGDPAEVRPVPVVHPRAPATPASTTRRGGSPAHAGCRRGDGVAQRKKWRGEKTAMGDGGGESPTSRLLGSQAIANGDSWPSPGQRRSGSPLASRLSPRSCWPRLRPTWAPRSHWRCSPRSSCSSPPPSRG
jgi:hypothetical protein